MTKLTRAHRAAIFILAAFFVSFRAGAIDKPTSSAGIGRAPDAIKERVPDPVVERSPNAAKAPDVPSKLSSDQTAPSRIADSLQAIAAAEVAASKEHASTGLSIDKLYPMVVSTFAFLLSGGLALYTFRKDGKARRQSISDDYWLRKVVSPVAIEPVVKFLLETVGSMPKDCSDSGFSVSNVDSFLAKYQKDHLAQSGNLLALALLSADLYDEASASFDEIEDAVIAFCSDNRQQLKDASGAAVHPRARASEAIRRKLNEMLQAVRDYQVAVK